MCCVAAMTIGLADGRIDGKVACACIYFKRTIQALLTQNRKTSFRITRRTQYHVTSNQMLESRMHA